MTSYATSCTASLLDHPPTAWTKTLTTLESAVDLRERSKEEEEGREGGNCCYCLSYEGGGGRERRQKRERGRAGEDCSLMRRHGS
jgi:hypothetical protein